MKKLIIKTLSIVITVVMLVSVAFVPVSAMLFGKTNFSLAKK